MDFSVPTNVIELAARLAADPTLAGKVQVAQNGGADLLYWTGPASGRAAAVARMRAIATATPGVCVGRAARGRRGRARGRRPGGVLPAGVPVLRPHPAVEPDPRQPRSPRDAADPAGDQWWTPGPAQGPLHAAPVRSLDVAPGVAALFGLRPPAGRLGLRGAAALTSRHAGFV